MSGSKEFLSESVREVLEDERGWSKKLLKLYKTLRKLEKRKYHGSHFSPELRQLVCFFAVKHMVGYQNEHDDGSIVAKTNLDEVLSFRGESQSPTKSLSNEGQKLSPTR